MKVTQSCLALCHPLDYPVHGILQTRILEWVAFLFSRGSSQPRNWTQGSPTLQEDSWLSELPGNPKNTGVGSPSLLQGIFVTQELNWGLLHCRWILYQLSYQGSPYRVYLHSFYNWFVGTRFRMTLTFCITNIFQFVPVIFTLIVVLFNEWKLLILM